LGKAPTALWRVPEFLRRHSFGKNLLPLNFSELPQVMPEIVGFIVKELYSSRNHSPIAIPIPASSAPKPTQSPPSHKPLGNVSRHHHRKNRLIFYHVSNFRFCSTPECWLVRACSSCPVESFIHIPPRFAICYSPFVLIRFTRGSKSFLAPSKSFIGNSKWFLACRKSIPAASKWILQAANSKTGVWITFLGCVSCKLKDCRRCTVSGKKNCSPVSREIRAGTFSTK